MRIAAYVILCFAIASSAWAFTTTTNMSLKTPATGDTDYPTSISDSFTLIDQHDHSSGKGVQVPTGGLADSAVTTAKLGALSVTGAKIAAATITKDKFAALGQQISPSSAGFGTSSASLVDVTNLSVTITTTGRPVFIGLVDDGAATGSYVECKTTSNPANSAPCEYVFLEGSTAFASYLLNIDNSITTGTLGVRHPSSAFFTIRIPAAGTYTYKMQTRRVGSDTNVVSSVINSKLIAFEL
jgi:hypothetical protein